MLSDSAVHVAFTESIVPGRRERVVKCRERTLRKIAQTMPTEEKLIRVFRRRSVVGEKRRKLNHNLLYFLCFLRVLKRLRLRNF